MYLSDRDLKYAVETGRLIVDPPPDEYDTTSIDLHLDGIDEAKVWDVAALERQQGVAGHSYPALHVGGFDHQEFAKQFHKAVPEDDQELVFRSGNTIMIRRHGFFVWQTREVVGTPELDPRHICFVDGKSTRARTGLLVHMTAPRIHAGWWGHVTLEIANLGPFTLALKPGDAIAQIIVATISSPPLNRKATKGVALGQRNVAGQARLKASARKINRSGPLTARAAVPPAKRKWREPLACPGHGGGERSSSKPRVPSTTFSSPE